MTYVQRIALAPADGGFELERLPEGHPKARRVGLFDEFRSAWRNSESAAQFALPYIATQIRRSSLPTLSELLPVADFITSVLQQEKRCIFCGNPPIEKNKEHVIRSGSSHSPATPNRVWHLDAQIRRPRHSEPALRG